MGIHIPTELKSEENVPVITPRGVVSSSIFSQILGSSLERDL